MDQYLIIIFLLIILILLFLVYFYLSKSNSNNNESTRIYFRNLCTKPATIIVMSSVTEDILFKSDIEAGKTLDIPNPGIKLDIDFYNDIRKMRKTSVLESRNHEYTLCDDYHSDAYYATPKKISFLPLEPSFNIAVVVKNTSKYSKYFSIYAPGTSNVLNFKLDGHRSNPPNVTVGLGPNLSKLIYADFVNNNNLGLVWNKDTQVFESYINANFYNCPTDTTKGIPVCVEGGFLCNLGNLVPLAGNGCNSLKNIFLGISINGANKYNRFVELNTAQLLLDTGAGTTYTYVLSGDVSGKDNIGFTLTNTNFGERLVTTLS